MVWLDVATPKYAVFLKKIADMLMERGHECVFTTRFSDTYSEVKEVLDNANVDYIVTGTYGGAALYDKFVARIERQKKLLDFITERGTPDVLISGCVVDSNGLAFGLGIPIINIYDIPSYGYEVDLKEVTAVARLTIPLSSRFYYPYVVPDDLILHLGLTKDQISSYDFIDVHAWMYDIYSSDDGSDFRLKEGIPTDKPVVLLREEEYNAHYLKNKDFTIYEIISRIHSELDCYIAIVPRYGRDYLEQQFGSYAFILKHKYKQQDLYPFIDLFIGGGGTMNLEASYYGVPTISIRKITTFYDKYLIDNNLMHWTDSVDEVLRYTKENLGKKFDNRRKFYQSEDGISRLVDDISGYINSLKAKNNGK